MSQSLSNALLHLIFSTKHRSPLIDKDIEPELYAYMVSVCTSCGSYVHKIDGIADHLHVLCTLPRTVSISDLLEQIKKTSSKWIKTKGPKYRDFSYAFTGGGTRQVMNYAKRLECAAPAALSLKVVNYADFVYLKSTNSIEECGWS